MMALARVAGFETALYGLPPQYAPILFEHTPGSLLVATTKLSQFITARYAPADSWWAIWQYILSWLRAGQRLPLSPEAERAAATVRPMYGPQEPLPVDVEDRALRAGTSWFGRAKLLIHPSWEAEARRRLEEWPDGTGPGPDADWPAGDGSRGMIEGASSTIHPDGSQNWRYHVRNDCMGESSMALAFAGAVLGDRDAAAAAAKLSDYVHFHSPHSGGPRADPASASYGLLCWTSQDVRGGVYYGDDNARSMLGTMAAAALSREERWDLSLLRCLLANLRTSGPLGFRQRRIEDDDLQARGWRHYWSTPLVDYAPHYESWLWACFLWAYRATGFLPFLERAETALRMTIAAYPDAWQWTNGMQQERARMLLPLAWLVRVDDTPEHRGWLHKIAQELLALQDDCGAIREEVGSVGKGSYGPPRTNEEYGTNEAPLIQQNGDPLCDLLYTTNFASIGLHEACAATTDPFYRRAEDNLSAFLCRIQVHSEEHPELHGAWFRAFDYRRWDYWASNADLGWGAWSIESGWTQGWITAATGSPPNEDIVLGTYLTNQDCPISAGAAAYHAAFRHVSASADAKKGPRRLHCAHVGAPGRAAHALPCFGPRDSTT